MPRVDDALQFIVSYLRSPRRRGEGISYGYDVYLPNICIAYARDVERLQVQDQRAIESRARELTGGVFYDAAWELCRRGILRPSVRSRNEQFTEDGSAGNGYSITSTGSAWIGSADAHFIPTEPSRVAELLGGFRDDFGDGFFQRAQEAAKCYSATAYLACCVMCGAATESVLLRLATEKKGSTEAEILKLYRSAGGRRRVEDRLLAGAAAPMVATFRNLTDLLKYWRDDASHGTASEISEFEAYEAIARLLRFVNFAKDHRTELLA